MSFIHNIYLNRALFLVQVRAAHRTHGGGACHGFFDWFLYAWLHPRCLNLQVPCLENPFPSLVSLPLVAPSFERGKFRKVAQELSERTDRISTCEWVQSGGIKPTDISSASFISNTLFGLSSFEIFARRSLVMLMLCVRRSTCACSALYTREGERETCHALFDWLDWLLYAWLHPQCLNLQVPCVENPLLASTLARTKWTGRSIGDRISTCEWVQ